MLRRATRRTDGRTDRSDGRPTMILIVSQFVAKGVRETKDAAGGFPFFTGPL